MVCRGQRCCPSPALDSEAAIQGVCGVLACAAAAACVRDVMAVMRQRIPSSDSSCRAAWMPSHDLQRETTASALD